MTLYLVSLLLLPIIFIISKQYDLVGRLLLIFLYATFIYMHIDSGPDHEVYRWFYENNASSSNFEPLFNLSYILAKHINLHYLEFLIFFRLFNVFLFSFFVLKAEKASLILFLSMYIPFSFLTFELNLLRQSLSLHFALIAYITYMNNKMKWSLLFIIMAILSHASAILMLLIFIKKVNRMLVLSIAVVVAFAIFNYELILLKISAYSELGDFSPRFDNFIIQLLVLIILPFIFFDFPRATIPVLAYLTIVLLSFIPLLVRLYPIALFFLLPYARFRYTSKAYVLILTLVAFSLTIMKTNLLIQYDKIGIDTGVIKSGYIK